MKFYPFFIGILLFNACLAKKEAPHQRIPPSEKVHLSIRSYPTKKFSLPGGKLLKVFIASTEDQQTQGLSGVKPGELEINEGMLFHYKKAGWRRFWMPNTFLNLDIYFLDEHYRILKIERQLPAHPGRKEPPQIARTSAFFATHVLEIPSSSTYNEALSVGIQLKPIEVD